MSVILAQSVTACLEAGEYSLPMLPESTGELLRLLQSAEVDFGAVEALVQQEASLAARVLRLANAPTYRRSQDVSSLRVAITRLGTRQVTRIALSEQMASVFHVPGFEDLARSSWWRARLSSVYAAALARRLGDDPDTAFVCGLLHGVGAPIVLQVVVRVADHMEERISRAAVLGWVESWYVTVGQELGAAWELPEVVQAAIAHHLHPMRAVEHRRYVQITALASAIARSSPPDAATWRRLAAHPVSRALALSQEDLKSLAEGQLVEDLAA
jgi:HD-like signal output (HDOD) protein